MDNIGKIIIICVVAIAKLVITGICLAIGFRIGGLISAAAEKRIANRSIKTAGVNVEQAVA